jgi:hypothetical protein
MGPEGGSGPTVDFSQLRGPRRGRRFLLGRSRVSGSDPMIALPPRRDYRAPRAADKDGRVARSRCCPGKSRDQRRFLTFINVRGHPEGEPFCSRQIGGLRHSPRRVTPRLSSSVLSSGGAPRAAADRDRRAGQVPQRRRAIVSFRVTCGLKGRRESQSFRSRKTIASAEIREGCKWKRIMADQINNNARSFVVDCACASSSLHFGYCAEATSKFSGIRQRITPSNAR